MKSVDTNGAGDAFTGAILYCIAADKNVLKVTYNTIYIIVEGLREQAVICELSAG